MLIKARYEQLQDGVDSSAAKCQLASEGQIRYPIRPPFSLIVSDEAEALVKEAKLLRQQISSMQHRLEILNKLAGGDDQRANNQVDQLTADLVDVNGQVRAS